MYGCLFFFKYKNPSLANVQKGVEILAEKQLSGKNLFWWKYSSLMDFHELYSLDFITNVNRFP